MWRPAHGATCKPGPARPGSGYGRAIGRPEPRPELLGDVGERGGEAGRTGTASHGLRGHEAGEVAL